MHVYPDYYNKFKCISSKCRHNCCIGWEIDIDDQTLGFYKIVEGELSNRFKENICYDDTAYFKLSDDERCPFLNKYNLCDIITALGEEHLCDICREHPRFHNELPNRVESGLGLCCEEAARIILSQKSPVQLCCDAVLYSDDEIINMRDDIIALLQNRNIKINERIGNILHYCNTEKRTKTLKEWCDILLTLEQLDPSWAELITTLSENYEKADIKRFDDFMQEREYEYEQFAVYIIYRHFANSPDVTQAQTRTRFTAFAYELLHTLGAVIYTQTGDFSFETQVELARLFSSEIEYSDENLYTLFDIV